MQAEKTPTTVPPTPTFLAQNLNWPNVLTCSRLVLAVVLFVLIAQASWIACIAVFALAAFTDWLDGFLARLQGLTSPLGRNLDPLVDKVLIGGAYIFLLPVPGSGLVPWMVTVVVARELIITSLRTFLETSGARFGADWLGKVKMVLQCGALLAIFAALEAPADAGRYLHGIKDVLIWSMLAATALSGLQYLWRAAMLLNQPE